MMKRFGHCALGTAALLSAVAIGSAALGWPSRTMPAQDDPPPVSFEKQILPVLKEHCLECHAGRRPRGEFSLDSRTDALEHETAVFPGDANGSRMIQLIRGEEPEMLMPFGDEKLPDETIELLARWVNEGFKWADGDIAGDADAMDAAAPVGVARAPLPHVTPRTPDLPPVRFGLSHPIDRIVDQYARDNDVELTPVIDDAAFLRRVSLDLTGLLPTVDERAAFLADESSDKRRTVIEILLNDDRRYAAHWLTFWNDHLRNDYAGTGYIDGGRTQITAWLFQSLLDNKPYNTFAAELVNPTPATAGFANGIRWRGEANASQRWELQYAQNIGQVFLGENLKCASCHDSFIDSWNLTDAYGLAAVIADEPLEMYRCDVATGEFAGASFPFPSVGTIDPNAPKGARLSRVAELLTSDDNGRFARTIVNRIWARMMGRGLVEPLDVMANDAWSEDLLDYLASDLVANGYDLRHTIELIVTSQAYQREAPPLADDDDGDFVFRGPAPQRMTAEQFVDAVWSLTGTWPENSDANAEDIGHRAEGEPVRAALMNANQAMRMLGRPNREQVVTVRPNTLTTLQALELMNGPTLYEDITAGAQSLVAQCIDVNDLVDHLYAAALCRAPTDDERALAIEFLGDVPTAESAADFLWAVLMLPEFQLVR